MSGERRPEHVRLSVTDPIVYFYGHLSPGDNPKLFNVVNGNLAAVVEKRLINDAEGSKR